MADPLKLTLDTNCVLNVLDANSKSATSVEQIRELIALGLANEVNIAVTTRLAADVGNDRDTERRGEMLQRIAMFPVIGSIARLDVTVVGSGDVLVGDDTERLIDEVTHVVFPGGIRADEKRFWNKTNDVDHLIGHLINSRDVFVTDDRDILRKHDQLKRGFGLIVLRPDEALAYVDAQLQREGPIRLTFAGYGGHQSPAHQESAAFDYSNNDGVFVLADGIYLVGTRWSKASDTAIHVYADHESVVGVALVKDVRDIADVTDVTKYDYSSRARTVGEGQIVVFRNVNDVYAVLKVREVEDDSRGAERDSVLFDYRVGEIGQSDFS